MLPLIVGQAEVPDFLEDNIYVDLRQDFISRITNVIVKVHKISRLRVSRVLAKEKPERVRDVWRLLNSVCFDPCAVLGKDDFDEMLKHGVSRQRYNYAAFDPEALLSDANVSDHVKSLSQELF